LDSLNHFTWPGLGSDIDLSCISAIFPHGTFLLSTAFFQYRLTLGRVNAFLIT
jgi:hypothetical protein